MTAPRDRPFEIVRHEQRIRVARRDCASASTIAALDVAAHVGVLLVVDARDLLIPLGHDAHLFGRRAPGVLDQAVARNRRLPPAARAAAPAAASAPTIADERRASAERGDVVRDVGGAAETHVLATRNCTTGTGASGEIRVTRPTMNRSSMTSPTTSTGRPAKRATRSRARAGVERRQRHAERTARTRAVGGERQRDEDQEQHQELRSRRSCTRTARRRACATTAASAGGGEQALTPALKRVRRDRRRQRDDEPQPDRAAPAGRARRRSAAARCAGAGCTFVDRDRRPVVDVEPLHHVRADAGQRMRADHPLADVQHRERSRTVGSFMLNIDA